MSRRPVALAVALVLVPTAALLGPAASAPVSAAPTPVDPGPPTPATQRLAFASQHHSELVVLDLDTGVQRRPFGADPTAIDTDPSAARDAVAFVSFRPGGEPGGGEPGGGEPGGGLADAAGSERDGEIWYTPDIRPDNPEVRQLTSDSFVDRQPSLSRDGDHVAFASTRNGNTDIWVVRTDGTGLRRLTDDPAVDDWPTWSPDGARLAFRSTRDDPAGDLYAMSADGTGTVRLTNDPAVDAEPAWEPYGDRIAFRTTRWDSDGDLAYTYDDGGSVNRIGGTGPGVHGSAPAWRPGSSEIAYVNREADRAGDVHLFGFGEFGPPVPVAAAPGAAEQHPSWLGIGYDRIIVYAGSGADGEDTTADIWRVGVDGTDLVDLSRLPRSHEDEPSYSPDGHRLAYLATGEAGRREIVVAAADGSAARRLDTVQPTASTALTWSPDGSMLAFTEAPAPPPPPDPPEIGLAAVAAPAIARVVVVRVDNGEVVASVPQPGGEDGPQVRGDRDPAWSPDGGTLAFLRSHTEDSETYPTSSVLVERVWLVSVDSAGPGRAAFGIPRPFSDRVDCPCGQAQDDGVATWSPGGDRLAFVRRSGGRFRLLATEVDDPDSVDRLLAYGDDGLIEEPAWSPDGRLIAFTGQRPDTQRAALFAIGVAGGDGTEFVVFDEVDDDFAADWQPFADLRLRGDISPEAIGVGSTATAVFTVVNDGPVRARGTRVSFTVPDGLTLVGVEPSQGTCDAVAHACALGILAPGDAAAVAVRVRGDVRAGYLLTAETASDVIDIEPRDNTAEVALRVGRGPDLAVTVTAAPRPGYVGGAPIVVTYTIRNEGEFPAPDVRLLAAVPAALPVLPGARCVPGPPCDLGTLGPGETITVRVELRPATAVNGRATARVRTSGLDADPTDDAATHPVVVIQPLLVLDPPVGPRGFVTDAVGRDFPPDALVALTWEPGLTAEARPVRVGRDGTFRTPVLIVRKDVLGERVLRARPVRGPAFTVTPPVFLVVPGAAQPRDFVIRN